MKVSRRWQTALKLLYGVAVLALIWWMLAALGLDPVDAFSLGWLRRSFAAGKWVP